ncbi:MAG: ATP-binding protein [Planctomycetaceae bacterium]|jgi:AAA15 family ATPase/GTPase|nr:ATP-binding protein [Planctomycetaceae bacterium]
MILELKIKNFLSFKEETIFSFEATKDKTFENYQVVEVAPGTRILRLAILYGANASGKSNLIKVFDFIQSFWFNKPENKDKSTGVTPFLLDKKTPQKTSEFSLTFYVEGIKYEYYLELDRKNVISEKLFVYSGSHADLIFNRKLNKNVSDITFNSKRIKINKTAKDEITIKCLTNMSVFAAYNQVNVEIEEIENVVKWIKAHYKLPHIESNTKLLNYAENAISENQTQKDFILNFLQQADYNITNINTEIIVRPISDKELATIINFATNISDNKKERIKKEKTIKASKTEFEHKIVNKTGKEEFYKLLKTDQSQGTLRTFGLAGVICETIESNAFLAIDEIESSLHPRLVEFIIEDFLKHKGQSQLLLTTHYDGLLEEDDLLRKDSIWFTNKKENGSTELYSLADFKGVDRISSLQKAYKYGKFGATPNI